MRKNRCFKLTALLLAAMMLIGALSVASAETSNSVTIRFWAGQKELDARFVTSAKILNGQDEEVTFSATSDPNQAYTLRLEVAEPTQEDTTDPEKTLPDNTDQVRLSYKLPANTVAESGENGDVSWTYDAASGDVVFNWVSGKKDAFIADIPVSPRFPETFGLNNQSLYILFALGNAQNEEHKRVLMLPETNGYGIASAPYNVEGTNTIVPQGRYARWTFQNVSGNWYTVSSGGQYLNISAGSATLSSTPQVLYFMQDSSGKYGIMDRLPGSGDVNQIVNYYLDGEWYRYFTAHNETGRTANLVFWSGEHVTANMESLTGQWAICVAVENRKAWRTVSSDLSYAVAVDGDSGRIQPKNAEDTLTAWKFTAVPGETNWYTIQNGAGKYLSVGDHSAGLSDSPAKVYIQNLGNGQVRLTDGACCGLKIDQAPTSIGNKKDYWTRLTLKKVQGVSDGQPLYNLVNVNGTYYRLAKTVIYTDVELTRNLGKTLNASQYQVDPYDFTDVVLTASNKTYIYNCPANEEAIAAGARYYEVTGFKVSCVANKIGGMNGNTPRWAIPEEQRYDDPNATDSFHRDYTVKLYDNPIEQDLYNFLKVDNSNNYYRLRKTRIIAGRLEEYGNNATLSSSQYQIPDGEYNFSGVTLTVGGTTYRYSDHELEGDYESYYTVRFDRVIKLNRINGNADWYANDEGWLDGAKEQYGAEGNDVTGWHRDYVATLHEGTIQPAEGDVTLYAQGKLDEGLEIRAYTDWPEGKLGFPGAVVNLSSELIGFENKEYTLQWQHSTDGVNWTDEPGANEGTYSYILSEENAGYVWRIVANDIKDKE